MSIKLSWGVARQRSKRAILAAEIATQKVFVQSDGAPDYSLIGEPAPNLREFLLETADYGTYAVKLVIVLKDGQSAEALGSVTIDDTSPPVVELFVEIV